MMFKDKRWFKVQQQKKRRKIKTVPFDQRVEIRYALIMKRLGWSKGKK